MLFLYRMYAKKRFDFLFSFFTIETGGFEYGNDLEK